ncbi:hypothetical protein OSB04_031995 [Centaurea solstitialis]|uniref:Mesoderm development candidate 2 n=1 Tax=Centaurea solstitialis TaxID=347529 RepID=A0AA38SU52_9ASTR|nr:hypothetical protein OSB04_031995 [Centaurea solstitialis]
MAVHCRSEEVASSALFSPINLRRLLLFFFLLVLITFASNGVVEGTKKRVRITDELDDVEDNEEDEAWKEWGRKKSMTEEEFDPPPDNFSELGFEQMREEVLKRQVGQSYGFVKLRLSEDRTPDMVSHIAEKWTNLARTGSIGVIFMGYDINTVMFTLHNAQNTLEFTDFLLSQPETYEIKMGDQFFRRPGDPPFEQLLRELYKKNKKRGKSSNDTAMKPELATSMKPKLETSVKTEL